jgi:LPS export ABC transporter protein LptC
MKPGRVLLYLVAALSIAGMLYTFGMLESGGLQSSEAGSALPRYTLNEAELSRYDSEGEPSLLGRAQSIEYFDDESGRAEQLQVDVLNGEAAPWHLSSPLASLPAGQRPGERKILLQAPVLVSGRWPDNGEALQIETERLWLDADAHQFYTDAAVKLDSRARDGTAVGLRADWRQRSLRLLHDVKLHYDAPR